MAHNLKPACREKVKEELVSDDIDQIRPTEAELSLTQEAQQEEKLNQQTYKEELYAGHVIKEELVIGPDVLQKASDCNITLEGALCPRMLQSDMQDVNNENCNEIYKEIPDHTTRGLTVECNEANDIDTDRVDVKVNESKNFNIGHRSAGSLSSLKHSTLNCAVNPAAHFVCSECEYQTVNREVFEKHLRFHDTSRPFISDSCGLRFDKKQCVLSYITRLHGAAKDGGNISKYETRHKGISKTHPSCTHNNEGHHFTCRINQKEKLKMPTDKKLYSFTYCNYICCNKPVLTHLRMHTSVKPYTCTYCNYSCRSESGLEKHLRTHTGEKLYSCTYCNYGCIDKCNLIRHLKIHTGEKPYSGTYCKYSCSDGSNLRPHLRKHTGEKPYSCMYCKYSCSDRTGFKRHLRKHSGEKPYSCTYCNYSTSDINNLRLHLRKHTGEQLYTCAYCNFCCINKTNLRRHLRIHTGEKPISSDSVSKVCNESK